MKTQLFTVLLTAIPAFAQSSGGGAAEDVNQGIAGQTPENSGDFTVAVAKLMPAG
jgi:hypothetical protein